MTQTQFTVLMIFLSVLLIINLVSAFLISKKKNSEESALLLQKMDESAETTAAFLAQSAKENAEAERNSRMELTQTLSAQRREVTGVLQDMTRRLDKMTRDNYEFNLQTTQAMERHMTELRKGNEEKLEQMRRTVDEKLNETLTQRLNSSFKTVSEQLENVYKSLGEMKVLSTGVTENVTSLNRILTNVKARGTWAEVQLEGLLDQTIPGMYIKNFTPNPALREVVEFAVKIPSGEDKTAFTFLPLDSKFPVEDYIRLCAAADSGDTAGVEAARKALETRVLAQAREVKKYINEPVTTPFAIMYLATEGLYSEILASKSAIAERCQNEFGVMLAGPGTITALLNSLAIGFRAMAINDKAKEVRALLAAAKMQYEKFGAQLEKARKKIDEAGRSLDDAQSRNAIIQKKLRSVEEIDRNEADVLLGIED